MFIQVQGDGSMTKISDNYKIELEVTKDEFEEVYGRKPKDKKEFTSFCEKVSNIIIHDYYYHVFDKIKEGLGRKSKNYM